MNKKILTFNCIIFSFIFIILFLVSINFCYGQEKNIPNIIEYKKINNQGMKFDDFNEIKNRNDEKLIFTAYSELKCSIKNGYGVSTNKDIKTKMILTDDKYFSLYPYTFISGGKLDYISLKEGSKIAVISEKLAISIYKNTNIIGNKIDINGEIYNIVGVYRTDESFLYNSSGDGYERIVVPYSSYKDVGKEKLNVDVLSVKGNNINNKDASYLFEDLVGSNLSFYNKEDYLLLKGVNFQYIKIMFFIIGFYIIILLFKLMIKSFKKLISLVKTNIKDLYFKELLSKKRKEIILFITKVILICVLIIIMFNLIKFNVVIDDKYLPSDNIFNFTFYKEAIIKDIQAINANESGFSNIYNRYALNISNIQKTILIVQVIDFFLLIVNLNTLIKGKIKNKVKKLKYV